MTKLNLSQAVAMRVRMVHRFRRLTDPLLVKSGSLFALLLSAWFQVSFWDVVANTPSLTRPGALSYFLYDAFQKTEWGVRGVALGVLVVSGGLFLQAWRNLRSWRSGWNAWNWHFLRFY